MNYVNNIINDSGLSKVKVAKFLGVSRQMLYNYLALDSINELPKDKQNKLLSLLGVESEEEIKNIKVDETFINNLNKKINEELFDSYGKDNITDLKGLNKKEQEILTNIFVLLKDKLLNDKNNTAYQTLEYLLNFLQTMEQVPEEKYILAYLSKSNCLTRPDEFIYNEEKQYTFEGILYTAMTLYNNGNASRSKVSESHKKFEAEIEQKKEEKLSRTEELTTFRKIALQELGYTTINDQNAKEVFEKIAEIMSRKF